MAKRYIDADALIKSAESKRLVIDTAKTTVAEALRIQGKAIREAIENAPAADVVEVVKCKDCEHYDISGWSGHERWCKCLFKFMRKDDFCSRGERRTDDD